MEHSTCHNDYVMKYLISLNTMNYMLTSLGLARFTCVSITLETKSPNSIS